LDARDEFADKGERISVAYGPFIQPSIVLDWSQLSVFLFDEEEGSGIRAFGWTYVTFLNMFLDEFLECFLFVLGEGVYFSGERGWGIFLKLYCMIL
jgi:hypothetical protein